MASWFKTGCYSCALAVALGAFGAHGLKSRVDPAMIEIWQTAVQYHFIHAFGMMLNAVAPKVSDNAGVHIAECFIQPIRVCISDWYFSFLWFSLCIGFVSEKMVGSHYTFWWSFLHSRMGITWLEKLRQHILIIWETNKIPIYSAEAYHQFETPSYKPVS